MTTAEEVYRKLGGKRNANGFVVPCPAHEDRNPSLSVSDDNGKLLWHCHAGCPSDSVQASLAAKGFTVKGETPEKKEIVYTVKSVSGEAIAQHVRVDKSGGKEVYWRGPNGEKVKLTELGYSLIDLPLYGSELLADSPNEPCWITEGEKAAEAARQLGVLALGTVTGASTAPKPSVMECLKGRKVYLWPDNDDEGRRHMDRVAKNLLSIGIKSHVVKWPDAPPKGDAADFIAQGKTAKDLAELLPKPSGKLKMLWQGVSDALDELGRYTAGDFSDRIQTGISTLDYRLCGGLRRKTLTLVGAPSGGGKTSLAQQVAVNVAKTKGSVLFISPEMGLEELAEREIIRGAKLPKWNASPKYGGDKTNDMERYAKAGSSIIGEKLPIYVLDMSGATMADIAEAAEQIDNLCLIVIDYAQEVADDTDSRKPRYLQVGDVGRQSVALAARLNIPIIVASQVNVITEGNSKDYKFRETEVLAQKANTTLILEVEREMDPNTGVSHVKSTKIICKKQRGGALFNLALDYNPGIYEISDKEPDMPLTDFRDFAVTAPKAPR